MAAVDRYSQVILEQWNLHHSQELPGPLPQLKKLKYKNGGIASCHASEGESKI